MIKKILLLTLIYLISSLQLSAQTKFAGNWMGKLNVQGMSIRVVFKISESNGGLKAIMGSPDQTDKEFPTDTVIVNEDTIRIFIKALMGKYEGVYTNDTTISGTLLQATMKMPLDLHRSDLSFLNERPQTPKKPYPYKEEEITFQNKSAGITLAGTFTYPEKEGKYPVVIMITGSGPQDRDETIFRHKPFLVIADHLTKNGIAVLRFDDRGTAKSQGIFSTATSLDFATDVKAALEYLKTRKEIENKNIGLIGHSEGGMIAPIIASENKDISFMVLLAGPGTKGKDLLLKQTELILKTSGTDNAGIASAVAINKKMYDAVGSNKDSASVLKDIEAVMEEYYASLPDSIKKESGYSKENMKQEAKVLMSPWFRYFVAFDPAPYLTKIKIPVLALNGGMDVQVEADDNIAGIDKYLKQAGNKNFKTIKLANLNHLFQTAKTGAPSEYAVIEETIAPVVLTTISEWIKEVTK